MNNKNLKAEKYFDGNALEFAKSISHDNLDKMASLVESKQIDTNQHGHEQMTFLTWAMMERRERAFEFLLKHNADPNLATVKGSHPVALAAGMKEQIYLKLLLQYHGDPNGLGFEDELRTTTYDKDGQPIIKKNAQAAVFIAIKNLRFDNLHLLMESGANMYAIDTYGFTPIYYLASLNQFEEVYYLLEHGVDPKNVGTTKDTLLNLVSNRKLDPKFSKAVDWQKKVLLKLQN